MRGHWRLLVYILRHKWYVFLECCRLGIPIRGLLHDLSKFSRAEWGAYVRSFYHADGTPRVHRDPTGYYEPTRVSAEFAVAWLHHVHHNPHHWQHWTLYVDRRDVYVLEIPLTYRLEMLADWAGAAKAKGGPGVAAFWEANKDKIFLSPTTRAWVSARIEEEV